MHADAKEVFVFLPVFPAEMKFALLPDITEARMSPVGQFDGDAQKALDVGTASGKAKDAVLMQSFWFIPPENARFRATVHHF